MKVVEQDAGEDSPTRSDVGDDRRRTRRRQSRTSSIGKGTNVASHAVSDTKDRISGGSRWPLRWRPGPIIDMQAIDMQAIDMDLLRAEAEGQSSEGAHVRTGKSSNVRSVDIELEPAAPGAVEAVRASGVHAFAGGSRRTVRARGSLRSGSSSVSTLSRMSLVPVTILLCGLLIFASTRVAPLNSLLNTVLGELGFGGNLLPLFEPRAPEP